MFLLVLVIIWLCLIFLILFNYGSSTDYTVHKSMTIKNSDQYGYGNFEQFKKEFNKKNWAYDHTFRYSFFDYPTHSKVHAGIIKFDHIGMIIISNSDFKKVTKMLEEIYEAEEKRSGLNQKNPELYKW